MRFVVTPRDKEAEIKEGFVVHLKNVFPLEIGRVLHDTKHISCHCNAR